MTMAGNGPPAIPVDPVDAGFRVRLIAIGFKDATIDHLGMNGVVSLAELRGISHDQFDSFIKAINRPATFDVVPPPRGPINYPYIATQKLKALRLWGDFCYARGRELQPMYFHNYEPWKLRCQELDAYYKEKATPTAPPPLKNDWRTFEELFVTYLGQFRSTLCGIPLTYVIREKEDVEEEEMNEELYDTIDDCLIATASFDQSSYPQDNKKVFNLLKPLIYSETSRFWQFASQYNDTFDGREAFLAIKRNEEGQSATEAKKAAAYKAINDAYFKSGSTRYTFDNYIATLQKSFNMLERLKEPVPETKKVQDFIRGISCSELNAAISLIWNNNDLLNSFEKCSLYLKTVYENHVIPRTVAKQARISSTNTRGRDDGKSQAGDGRRNDREPRRSRSRNGKRADSNKGGNLPRVRTGNYSHEEYAKLTDKEKEEVKRLRKEKKNGHVSSTNTSSSKKNDNSSSASVSAISTVVASKPAPKKVTAAPFTTIQRNDDGGDTITTSPTLTLGKSTVKKTNINIKPYWYAKLYVNEDEKKTEAKKPEEPKPTCLDAKIAAVDTTVEDGEIVSPHQVIDMDDADDEVAKLTQAIPPPDIDWRKLPRHDTNSPQLFGRHVNWNQPMPEMIKRLQKSSWFVTPLSECDERQKGKRESFKQNRLYKELIKWINKQEDAYEKYGPTGKTYESSEDDLGTDSDDSTPHTRYKRVRVSKIPHVRPPGTGPRYELRHILE
jgi:hypothetical protein